MSRVAGASWVRLAGGVTRCGGGYFGCGLGGVAVVGVGIGVRLGVVGGLWLRRGVGLCVSRSQRNIELLLGCVRGWECLCRLAGDRSLHKVHPHWQGGLGSGLLFSKRLAVIEADPGAAGDRRREADEPCIGVVVRGAGLASEGMLEGGGDGGGSMLDDTLKERHHGAGGVYRDDLADLGELVAEGLAVCLDDLADVVGLDADAVVRKDGVGSDLLGEGDVG